MRIYSLNISFLRAITCASFMLLAFAYGLNAQTVNDAFTLSQQSQIGTARSVAMGQAGVALGGDIGFISTNPAASAVYRFNEFTFTPMLNINSSKTNFLNNSTDESQTRFGVSNIGIITSYDTGKEYGFKSWSLGITFNRMNDLNSKFFGSGVTADNSYLKALSLELDGNITGYELDITDDYDPFNALYPKAWPGILAWNALLLDTLNNTGGTGFIGATENEDADGNFYIGGKLDQEYYNVTKGNISEGVLNFGANISDKLYLGANIGVQSISYSVSTSYSEYAHNSNDFQTGFVRFTHNNNVKTTGSGINFKVGLIYTPIKSIRIGASISTPTWMYLHDEYSQNMFSKLNVFEGGKEKDIISEYRTPVGAYDYYLRTPFRWNVGAAYVCGQYGTISIDYERVNYSSMKLKDFDFPNEFKEDNNSIKSIFKASNIVRIGSEFRFIPEAAFRLGFQYYNYNFDKGSSYNNSNNKEMYLGSIGVGFASPYGFFGDIAYQQQFKDSKTSGSIYDGANISKTWKNARVLLTLGYRF